MQEHMKPYLRKKHIKGFKAKVGWKKAYMEVFWLCFISTFRNYM